MLIFNFSASNTFDRKKMKDSIFTIISTFLFYLVKYFLIAGTLFCACYYWFRKKFAKNKIQTRSIQSRDLKREILHSLQALIVFTCYWVILVKTPIKSYTLLYDDLTLKSLVWFMPSILVALIIHDTYFYWMHRALHHKRLFHITHHLHHRSSNPTPFASYSFHLLESMAEGVVVILIVFLIPMHIWALTLFAILAFAINAYGHLGYEIAPLWLRKSKLFLVINTSIYHNLHHKHSRGNYGLYFRFWDRIMKTEDPNYIKQYDKIQQRRLK